MRIARRKDAAGTFGERIAALGADAVIDMICFTPESAAQLVDALRPTRPLLLHCGTIWVHGPAARVPVTEDEPRTAYGAYGVGKAAIEALLLRETLAGGVPSTILHPGHITGPGWPVITPAGNLDQDVWRRLATGEPVALPDLGLGVLHHVHADDVAQAFERALTRPAAIGSSFHVVAEQAMTLRGLAYGAAAWWGREPVLEYVDWDEYERRVGAGARFGDARARWTLDRGGHLSGSFRAWLCAPVLRTGGAARFGVRRTLGPRGREQRAEPLALRRATSASRAPGRPPAPPLPAHRRRSVRRRR